MTIYRKSIDDPIHPPTYQRLQPKCGVGREQAAPNALPRVSAAPMETPVRDCCPSTGCWTPC